MLKLLGVYTLYQKGTQKYIHALISDHLENNVFRYKVSKTRGKKTAKTRFEFFVSSKITQAFFPLSNSISIFLRDRLRAGTRLSQIRRGNV